MSPGCASVAALAQATGVPVRGPEHEMSAWLRGRMAAIWADASTVGIATCPHLSGVVTDEPAHVGLWEVPLRAHCVFCALTELRLYGDADNTCDRCGVVSPGGVYSITIGAGPLVIHGGLCAACVRHESPGGDE